MLATRNVFPSLEEIPLDVKSFTPSLVYYSRNINSKKYTVLHPRDFFDWSMKDLDETFESILKEMPDVLVIDLKDSAGGAFEQVLYLSFILDVQKQFKFYGDYIFSKEGVRITGIDNFNSVTKKIKFKNIWKGKVIFRINPITKSGGDFFSRWMQLAKRGPFIGQPTAGSDGGTDDFTLNHTKTVIEFPLRERIIVGDDKSIEANSIIPDIFFDGNLIEFLKESKLLAGN